MLFGSVVSRYRDVTAKIRENGFAWATQQSIKRFRTLGDQRDERRFFRLVIGQDTSDLADLFTTPSNKPLKVQTIHLEHTTFCNLRCPGCHLTNQVEAGNWKYEHMDIEDYKRVLKNLPAAGVFALVSFGEPTMHPDFPELLRLARDSGKFDTLVTTSNITIRKGDYYDDLFDIGLNHLTVSVDSFDPIIADQLRTRTKVDKLRSTLEHLIARYAEQMHVATVVSKTNLHDLKNTFGLINQMAEKGPGKVHISLMKFDDMLLEGMEGICLTSDDFQLLQEFTEQWKEEFPNLNFGPIPVEKERMPTPTSICKNTWSNIKVSVKGNIDTCTYRHEPFLSPELCDLKSQSYEEVMASQAQLDYLAGYLEKSPDFCDGCPANLPR
jgi:MoaA/NifB/PqqE/SkfB family radical SAM enzyme